MNAQVASETRSFQAEVKQILDLVIHSLYSNHEIFLRELISNASDANDKLRFNALADESLYEGEAELGVWVEFDAKAKTITVRDNGIGMSRDEVVDNIGTIASSGTKRFFQALTGDQAKDSRLIGQFGVGFYASFIVADKVTLITRRAGEPADSATRWVSEGQGEYTLESVTRDRHGTEIVLHLRDDQQEFLDDWRLRDIIHKYSDHISWPIHMRQRPEKEGDEPGEFERVNAASALWMRNKSEVTEEEYHELYKHIAHDFEDPLAYVHSRVEGKNEYSSLFFIPGRAPFDLWDRNQRHGIKLYVRRVFIMDDAEHLMPNYLRFVRGVVDSDDLPLNVSREILQSNKVIDSIRGASVKRILGQLESMAAEDAEKYGKFWGAFGKVMKEGPAEDFANKERIAKLLRFASTRLDTDEESVSLDEYISRMPDGQKAIYYITADGFAAAKHSPHLEAFRKRDIEVLLLHDRVDEWLVSALTEYEGKPLQSVAKGELDLGDLDKPEEKEAREKTEAEFADVRKTIEEALGDKVKEVRVSHRLTESPACVVADKHDMSANLERILKSVGQSVGHFKPILEINPTHPLVVRLKGLKDKEEIGIWSQLLLDQALLSEGAQIDDPAGFVKRLNQVIVDLSGK